MFDKVKELLEDLMSAHSRQQKEAVHALLLAELDRLEPPAIAAADGGVAELSADQFDTTKYFHYDKETGVVGLDAAGESHEPVVKPEESNVQPIA